MQWFTNCQLTEANNRQQVAIQNAVLTSQANLAEVTLLSNHKYKC